MSGHIGAMPVKLTRRAEMAATAVQEFQDALTPRACLRGTVSYLALGGVLS